MHRLSPVHRGQGPDLPLAGKDDEASVGRISPVLFVGHRAVELQGARDAGMKTIAFNYDDDAFADYFVEKFADLLTVPVLAGNERPAQVDA